MAGFIKQRKKIPITMKRSQQTKLPQLVPVDIQFPLPGIHLEKPRDQIVAGGAIDTDGISLRFGTLERAHGWTALGSALDSAVMSLGVYVTDSGSFEVLGLSTKELYKYITDWSQIPQDPAGDLTGSDTDNFWSAQIGSDLLFCQGVDPVMRYAGGANFEEVNANCPPAKTGIGHQGRLLLGHTFEGGFEYPRRVRWNVIDDIVDWVGAGSGFVDFEDTPDYVTGLAVLGVYPVIFKEKTIIVGNRTGLTSPVYEFINRDDVNGTYAPLSIVNLGTRLAYIGKNDIFVFDLNQSTSIGEPVKSRFFDEINPAYRNQCVAYLDESRDEVHFCVPTGNYTYNNIEWIWNRKDNTWCRRAREVKCIGTYLAGSSPRWDDLTTTRWNDFLQRWKSGSLIANSQSFIVGTRSGVVYKQDPASRSAAGSAFQSFYEFGDIQLDPSKYTGISFVEIGYKDVGIPCTMTVGLSNDGGKSWSEKSHALVTGTASGKIQKTNFFNSLAGRNVSLRIYNNSSNEHFEIVSIRFWCISVGK